MTVFLTILTLLGLSILLIASYLVHVIQDSISINEELGEEYRKENSEEYLGVMGAIYSLFRIAYSIGFLLTLCGIGMMVYRLMSNS